MTYLLELGRIQELSLLEISRLFSQFSPDKMLGDFAMVEETSPEVFIATINKSGGVKRALKKLAEVEQSEVLNWIVEYLKTQPRPTFTLNFHDEKNEVFISPTEVKKELKSAGVSSRFIEHSSTALFLHHPDTIDLIGIIHDDKVIIAQTIWVQNIDDWTLRDRVKPYRDRKKGMLPPKLARVMINAISSEIQNQKSKQLYDPFCGTGTVLMEGSLLNWKVSGSDLSAEAVHGTATNMHWFSTKYAQPEPERLFISDATQTRIDQLPGKIDAIVTEPFLGKPQPKSHELPNIFKGLEKLYLGTFKQWTKILQPGGEVVIIFPVVETPTKTFSLEKLIDNLKSLGYNLVSGPIIYRREQTIVQRAIYVFKFEH